MQDFGCTSDEVSKKSNGMVEGISGKHYYRSAGKIKGRSKVTRAQMPGSLCRSWFHGRNWCHGKYTAQSEIPTRKR